MTNIKVGGRFIANEPDEKIYIVHRVYLGANNNLMVEIQPEIPNENWEPGEVDSFYDEKRFS
jgi:hypothetical protein